MLLLFSQPAEIRVRIAARDGARFVCVASDAPAFRCTVFDRPVNAATSSDQ